jgi:hypothetical protein
MFQPGKARPASDSSADGEYVIVSGRLTRSTATLDR